jgi:hypothetical protein
MSHTLIHNGTLIDGRGGEPVRGAAVLIRDNMIQQAGRKVDMTLPDAKIKMRHYRQ